METESIESVTSSHSKIESRFGSIDQTKLEVEGSIYAYLRIKNNPFTFSSSEEFEHIIILPNTEANVNFIVLLKRPGSSISNPTMHKQIKHALNVS